MGFKKGIIYELVDAKGLASSHGANPDLVNDILETGGVVVPQNVSPTGDVIGLNYGDGSYNYFGTLWASESRFFKTRIELNKRVCDKYPTNPIIDRKMKKVDYEYTTTV